MKKVYTIFLLILFAVKISAGDIYENTPRVKAIKTDSEIKVDGILDEEIWKNKPVTGFTQRDPEEGKPETQKTNVWVAYDEENLYIAAKLYDSNPEEIDVSLARKDREISSDWFRVDLDPYHDKRTGYFFGVNAGGTIIDGTYSNDGWDDDSWDGIWDVETSLQNDGWSVEMKIPFSQLRFNNSEDMVWGINFVRRIKRNKESSYFVMVPKKESGYVSHFAELVGLKKIDSKQRIEVIPYLVQKAQYLVHDENDPFYKGNQYKTNIGADFKIGIGNNFNLDLTVNPDFGQVEVDPAVVNLSAFETFFREKRPFFIEGSSIFNFGFGGSNNNWGFDFGNPDLFYSRRIGRSPHGYSTHEGYVDKPKETRIISAAKLTGKTEEGLSVGILSGITERTYSVTDSSGVRFEDEIEPLTHYGVVRVKKEFNKGEQSLGMIFTSVNRDLRTDYLESRLTKQAYTFGLDGWTFLDKDQEYVITGNVIGSYVSGTKEAMSRIQQRYYHYFQRPDAEYETLDTNRTSMSGMFSRIMLNKQKGNFYINSAIGFVSPTFEYNDLGSQWMADKINGHIVTGYRWFEPDGLFRDKSFYVSYTRSQDFDGNLLGNRFWGTARVRFMDYSSIRFNFGYRFDTYSKFKTRGGPMTKSPGGFNFRVRGNTDSRKDFVVSLGTSYSEDKYNSKSYDFDIDFDWQPMPQLTLSFNPEYEYNLDRLQWIGAFDDDLAVNTYGRRYVFGKIKQETISSNIRINWTFTPTLSLQVFLQPLFSVGKYSEFKELKKPSTYDYLVYGENSSTVKYEESEDGYYFDPDGEGPAEEQNFGNPDFNYKSFRGNVVLRWEVLPGSVFYFAWSHDQWNHEHPGRFKFARDFRDLINSESNDVFLVKFSYWFGT